MNKIKLAILNKGYTVPEFLKIINRKDDWFRTHSEPGAKDYPFLLMAVEGLEHKNAEITAITLENDGGALIQAIKDRLNNKVDKYTSQCEGLSEVKLTPPENLHVGQQVLHLGAMVEVTAIWVGGFSFMPVEGKS